jgi:prefoldin subunit 5
MSKKNKAPVVDNTPKPEETDAISKSLKNLKNKLKKLKKREEEIIQELQFSQNKDLQKHLTDIKSSIETIEQCITSLENLFEDENKKQTQVKKKFFNS